MNWKNFIVGGIVGGLVDWICGFIFYGNLFKDLYPMPADADAGTYMMYIILGAFSFGFFVSYIFNKWAGIKRVKTGLMAGATIGLLNGLTWNFYEAAGTGFCIKRFSLLVFISIITTALIGAAIAFVNGKMSDEANA